MRKPKLEPTPGARRVDSIPVTEFYLGFRVRSLCMGAIGMIVFWDEWNERDEEYYIEAWWLGKDAVSRQIHSNYDLIEEYLEEEELV